MVEGSTAIPPYAPKPGSVWAHYKGSLYRVTRLVRHSETREIMVEYVSHELHQYPLGNITEPSLPWVRPLAMWHEAVPVVLRDGPTIMRVRFTFEGWVQPT